MPETEADAEPNTSDSQSGGATSNVDEESDSDVDEEIDSDIDEESGNAVSYTHLTLPTTPYV